MSFQRRRKGVAIVIWPSKDITDARGNHQRVADEANKFPAKAWVIPQRSARAEVPGQQEINVVRLGVDADLSNVDLYSRVEHDGGEWDVVTPPAKHYGSSRHVRHWSIDVRRRP